VSLRVSPFLVSLVLPALALVGCGKKGPPLAPLRPVPARIEDLSIRRLGSDVYLQFRVPSKNADGTTPADVAEVRAFALTGNPALPDGRALEARDFVRLAAPVGRVDVEPPPPPPPKEGPAPPPPPPDPRPAQGELVVLKESLTAAAMVPFVHPLQKEFDRRQVPVAPEEVAIGPLTFRRLDPLSRVYVVAGYSRHEALGPLSARLRVPLTPPPDAPSAPVIQYDESKLTISWTPPSTARLPMQAAAVSTASAAPGGGPAAVPPLTGRPLFAGANPHTYNVYEVTQASTPAVATPLPVNARPVDVSSFVDGRLAFGVERCYVVRTVEASPNVTIESAASPMTCVTPRDTFPPAAPRNLAAVGAEGAVSLIWESNTEKDLAGYVVLRGPVPGDRLEALTPTPIRETTYRDASVVAGGRYVYAIVAVDSASPPNVSVESNRVEEGGR